MRDKREEKGGVKTTLARSQGPKSGSKRGKESGWMLEPPSYETKVRDRKKRVPWLLPLGQ